MANFGNKNLLLQSIFLATKAKTNTQRQTHNKKKPLDLTEIFRHKRRNYIHIYCLILTVLTETVLTRDNINEILKLEYFFIMIFMVA